MESRKIVIPGGSGFIGESISRYFLGRGYEVVVLSRTKSGFFNGISYVLWDASSLGLWTDCLEGACAVINLTGRSINCRFSKKNKEDILKSRVDSVTVLLNACSQSKLPPLVFVQASSIGYYGNTASLCTEESLVGSDFLAQVCLAWEETFWSIPLPSTRKVVLRFGIVLDGSGGAMQRILPWVRRYMGGHQGNGQQQMSWIHLEDLSRLIDFSINNTNVVGKFNATSDFPVTNAVFMLTLRLALNKPWSPPVPALLVRLVALLFMRTDSGVVLHGVACSSKRIQTLGFVFNYPRLIQAFRNILD